jgi:hypothetical protein
LQILGIIIESKKYIKRVIAKEWICLEDWDFNDVPEMFLALFNISHVWTIRSQEFLGKFIALIETFGSNINAVFQIVEFILQDLQKKNQN